MGVQVFDIKPTLAEILEVGIPIGSMALGVQTKNSDYDVYMTANSYALLFKHSITNNINAIDSKNYNAIKPRDGYCKIIYKFKTADNHYCDILVLEYESDLTIIKLAMNDLATIPKYLMKDKPFRIAAFQNALLHYGFIVNPTESKQSVSNYELKIYPIRKNSIEHVIPINHVHYRNPVNTVAIALYSYFHREINDKDIGCNYQLTTTSSENWSPLNNFLSAIISTVNHIASNPNDLITQEQYDEIIKSDTSSMEGSVPDETEIPF